MGFDLAVTSKAAKPHTNSTQFNSFIYSTHLTLILSRGFAGDAVFVFEKLFGNGGGIEAPARGQLRNFVHVGRDGVPFAEVSFLGRIAIITTFEGQVAFGGGAFALKPERPSCPGISSHHAAIFRSHPGVM